MLGTIGIHNKIMTSNVMPGDSFDARATLVLYEHWFSFFRGQASLRDLPIFYPAQNLLAASDANFFQGIIFSLFRYLEFSLQSSLKLTIIGVTLIGLVGVARLSLTIFQHKVPALAAAMLAITSYQIIAQSGHLQTWIYLWTAWVINSVINISRGEKYCKSLSIILIGIPLLALSAWYTFLSLILFGGIFTIISFCIDPVFFRGTVVRIIGRLRDDFKNNIIQSNFIMIGALIPTSVFVYIYISKLSDRDFGKWSEVFFYSPRLFDIVNASIGTVGWQADLYSFLRLDVTQTFERAMGLTISIILLMVFGFFLMIWTKYRIGIATKSILITALITLVLPLTDDRGQSLWFFINKLPLMSSVRTPARFWIFSSIIISWVMVIVIWKIYFQHRRRFILEISFLLIASVLSIMQFRSPMTSWSSDQLLTPFGIKAQAELKENKCQVFYLSTNVNLDIYASISRQIDGMIIATINDMKTINGYTSNPPKDWPQTPVWGLVGEKEVRNWVSRFPQINALGVCIVNESGIKIIN